MVEPAPNPELLRSLGRLVRGLSAVFWGLPGALLVCVGTAYGGWFGRFGFIPPPIATGVVLFGLWQLGYFQKQERPWRGALERARLLGLINVGLSPFVFWWNQAPNARFFGIVVFILALSALVFLFNLNLVVARLGAMLPDENLRQETRQLTSLNRILLIAPVLLSAIYVVLLQKFLRDRDLPTGLAMVLDFLDNRWPLLLVPFVLLPLAMTMALLWKTKEVILDSVFGAAK
jgi:hypothetical protein